MGEKRRIWAPNADEPTSGLDPVMQARLLEVLDERAREGRTVFFSSHVLGEVDELCDRVAMVRREPRGDRGDEVDGRGRTDGRVQPSLALEIWGDPRH